MNKITSVGTAGVALAVLLAGCGDPAGQDGADPRAVTDPGRDSSEAGVREVVDLVAAGLVDGDGPRVCSLLSTEAQRVFERAQASTNCIAAVAAASRGLGGTERAALRDARWEVTTHGDRATVTGDTAAALAATLGTRTIGLERVEGRWAVADPS
jgi:hypothetical protein